LNLGALPQFKNLSGQGRSRNTKEKGQTLVKKKGASSKYQKNSVLPPNSLTPCKASSESYNQIRKGNMKGGSGKGRKEGGSTTPPSESSEPVPDSPDEARSKPRREV